MKTIKVILSCKIYRNLLSGVNTRRQLKILSHVFNKLGRNPNIMHKLRSYNLIYEYKVGTDKSVGNYVLNPLKLIISEVAQSLFAITPALWSETPFTTFRCLIILHPRTKTAFAVISRVARDDMSLTNPLLQLPLSYLHCLCLFPNSD